MQVLKLLYSTKKWGAEFCNKNHNENWGAGFDNKKLFLY